jgi:hypothetical protein
MACGGWYKDGVYLYYVNPGNIRTSLRLRGSVGVDV